MARAFSAPTRLVAASLIDWTGTGFYLAVSAIFLTRTVGLTLGQAGLALSAVGLVAFAGGVPIGRLGDRYGHREVLLALHVVRAAAFLVLAGFPEVPPVLAMLSVIALADQAAASLNQALAAGLVGEAERVAFMGRLRTVANIGITLGTLPAGIALAGQGDAFGLLLAANAGSYLVAAALVATLPRQPAAQPSSRRRSYLIASAPTVGLIAIDGLMSMWNVVLNVGLPLWILHATSAAPALVAVLYATNTVLVVFLQTAVSRRVRTYRHAARAQRTAGLLLAACCACVAASALAGRELSTVLLVGAVLCLTLAEVLKTSAAWQITFTLAPAGRGAEFFSTYGLGRTACQVCGPILLTAVVLALGSPGWLLLGAVFILGALVTPAMAGKARARPVVNRRGPRRGDGPSVSPLTGRQAVAS